MADPNSPDRKAARQEIDTQSSADFADNISQAAQSFDHLSEAIKNIAPDLKSLVGDQFMVLPDLLTHAADTTETWGDAFTNIVEKAKEFDDSILKTAPKLKSIVSDPGYGFQTLPDIIEQAADGFELFGAEAVKIQKPIGVFDKMRLNFRYFASQYPMFNKIVKPLSAVELISRRTEKSQAAMAKDLEKSAKEAQKTADELKDANKEDKSKSASQALGAAASSMYGQAWLAVKKIVFATWEYVDTKVLPTQVALNKELGGTQSALSGIQRQALKTGNQFWKLGMSFEQGAKAVTEIGAGLQNVNIPDKDLQSILKLSEYVGVGAKEATALANQYIHIGGSLSNFEAAMKDAAVSAKELNVPVQGIRKDFAENIDLVTRFGTANFHAFNQAIGKAHQYGLTLKDLDGAFGKQLDTFKGTSDVAAKLNATFGTTINSIQLLQEQDPSKRMEMISKAFGAAGINFDKLSAQEQNLITETLHLTNQQAALVLSGEKGRKQYERMAAQQGKNAKASQDWDNALGRLRSTLVNTEAELSGLFRAISDVVAKFLGLPSSTKGAVVAADTFKNIIGELTKRVQKFADEMPKNENGIANLTDKFEKVTNAIISAASALGKISYVITHNPLFGNKDLQAVDAFADKFEKISNNTGVSEEAIARVKELSKEFDSFNPDQKREAYSQLAERGINKERANSLMTNYAAEIASNKAKLMKDAQAALDAGKPTGKTEVAVTVINDGSKNAQIMISKGVKKSVGGSSSGKTLSTARANF